MRWSYELLDATQRQVFDRLSVFAGPFTIEAAEAVVAGEGVDEWEVLDAVLALVDKSLVLADEATTGTRYRFLETMRQFGGGGAGRGGDRFNLPRPARRSLHRLRAPRGPQLFGSGDQQALDEIGPEFENIRVALRVAARSSDSSRFEELFSYLYPFFMGRSRRLEGLPWAGELLTRSEA